ncbi:MAG: winged helix-turn-helix transcriptional regulator [Erysipelotrichaceae bacterium]|nr:winged helix-turn-helix transcriptional regulator [Erysipelotrichaceae bacterium]
MDSVMKYISRIHRCFRQWQSDKMQGQGINGVQQNYLFHISHQPGISQEQLSDHIMVNKSNVARQLSTLENEGWITRQTSATDKRVYEVYPTEKTMELMPEILSLMKQWNALILEDLSEEEKETLLALMPKITKKARQIAESERDHS